VEDIGMGGIIRTGRHNESFLRAEGMKGCVKFSTGRGDGRNKLITMAMIKPCSREK
jgi:hypothetical protein